MSLKAIRPFVKFDWANFSKCKQFTATACKKWYDYEDKSRCHGVRVEVAITQDATEYPVGRDGETISNLYEKLTFKVAREINVPVGAIIEPIDVTASVYGDYGNMLSIKAADVKIVTAATAKA